MREKKFQKLIYLGSDGAGPMLISGEGGGEMAVKVSYY